MLYIPFALIERCNNKFKVPRRSMVITESLYVLKDAEVESNLRLFLGHDSGVVLIDAAVGKLQ